MHPDHVIGIDLAENDGVLTDRIKEPVPVLEGKVAAFQKHSTAKPVLVASDSTYDIPLFKFSSDMRILVRSTNGKDFFKVGRIRRDETWIVFDSPSLIDQKTWPMQP